MQTNELKTPQAETWITKRKLFIIKQTWNEETYKKSLHEK